MSIDENLSPSQPEEASAAEESVEESGEKAAQNSDTAAEPAEDRFAAFAQPTAPKGKKAKKKGMSKRVRTIILACVAVVVLVAILLAITLLPMAQGGSSTSSEPSDAVSTPTFTVLDKSVKDAKDKVLVKEIHIKNAVGDYTIFYNEKEKVYLLKGYEDMQLNEFDVSMLTDTLTKLTATEKMSNTDKLAAYGLDKPTSTVETTYHDNSKSVILVGNKAPSGNGYYIKLKDSNEVYIAQNETVSSFLYKETGYVDKTMIATPEVKEDDKDGKPLLKEFRVSGRSHPQPLAVRRTVPADGKDMSFFSYLITEPYLRGTDENVSNQLISFTNLSASDVLVLHPTAKDKEKYGFHNPLSHIELTLSVESTKSTGKKDESGKDVMEVSYYNSVTAKLTIAAKDEDGNYIVMMDGLDAIYTVSSSTLSCLADKQYADYVTKMLFLKDITQVGKIRVVANGKTSDFVLKHVTPKNDDDEDLIVTCNGKTLSTSNFRGLYQLMMGLQRYSPLDKKPTGKPDMSLTLWDNDGKVYFSADFYPGTGSLYHVCTQEGELFAVRASNITHFMLQVDNYLAGKEVVELVK